MNNFLATYFGNVNCTSDAVVASCATNTPPTYKLSNNQAIIGFVFAFYIGVTACCEQ